MLRDFAAQDQAAVQGLILEGLRERWGDDFDEGFNDDVRDITGNYLARGAEVVVVESDQPTVATGSQPIIATGTLVDEGNGRARIVRMSVAASCRRQGLGAVVVRELVKRARDLGFEAIDVATDTPWTSAVALYRSCGFTEISRNEVDVHFAMDLSAQ